MSLNLTKIFQKSVENFNKKYKQSNKYFYGIFAFYLWKKVRRVRFDR